MNRPKIFLVTRVLQDYLLVKYLLTAKKIVILWFAILNISSNGISTIIFSVCRNYPGIAASIAWGE